MGSVSNEHGQYKQAFEQFVRSGAAGGPPWICQLREVAMRRFEELGFPTTRQEEWKYTNTAPIAKTNFVFSPAPRIGLAEQRLIPFVSKETEGVRLVFVNGHFSQALSALPSSLPDGVLIGSLATTLATRPECVIPHLARYAGYQDHAFVALNTAFVGDGAFVYIPPGQMFEPPIQLLFVTIGQEEPTLCHPRNLLVLAPHSQATIAEEYIGIDHGTYLTNAVTELLVSERATADHSKLQQESPAGIHMATLQVQQDHHSTVASHVIACGGTLSRNEVNAALIGEGSDCTLNGLYLATDEQHVDLQTRIDHTKPHCRSRELYKGVLGGKAQGVFNGNIIVHTDAHKTDATQANKNLLLSEGALVNSKPQLEIYNDDVRCSHGSTTGQLDQDALFYLRARGLDSAAASRLLTYAFASEVLQSIKIEQLQRRLETLLTTTLQNMH